MGHSCGTYIVQPQKDSKMLILSRKIDEGIAIGDDVEVYVLGILHNRVKIGVKAPNDTLVLRKELQNRDKS